MTYLIMTVLFCPLSSKLTSLSPSSVTLSPGVSSLTARVLPFSSRTSNSSPRSGPTRKCLQTRATRHWTKIHHKLLSPTGFQSRLLSRRLRLRVPVPYLFPGAGSGSREHTVGILLNILKLFKKSRKYLLTRVYRYSVYCRSSG